MDDRTLFALLERKGYRRWDIERLTREYVREVLFHPTGKYGEVDVQAHAQRPVEEGWQTLYRHWRVRGLSTEESMALAQGG